MKTNNPYVVLLPSKISIQKTEIPPDWTGCVFNEWAEHIKKENEKLAQVKKN